MWKKEKVARKLQGIINDGTASVLVAARAFG